MKPKTVNNALDIVFKHVADSEENLNAIFGPSGGELNSNGLQLLNKLNLSESELESVKDMLKARYGDR